uniref:Secreted protein n=1 Tax=Panagrellus redivivus TaxID=6233 RepID=A0A7E4VIR2_PANRE
MSPVRPPSSGSCFTLDRLQLSGLLSLISTPRLAQESQSDDASSPVHRSYHHQTNDFTSSGDAKEPSSL